MVCVAKLFSDNAHTHRMLRQWWDKNVRLKFLQYHAYRSGDRIERSLHSPKRNYCTLSHGRPCEFPDWLNRKGETVVSPDK